MIQFSGINVSDFLTNYWQKKPLVLRNALPEFTNLLSAEELAGLAMEEEIDSRMVFRTPEKPPFWHLKNGPFVEKDFRNLPKTHWTLLVQGVDRVVPELALLFNHFDFIPQWRVDDLMISYATESGSVGPHYDNYDVFLYQAKGSRKWSLTSKHCNPDNCLPDIPLRIMQTFDVEEEYILEEGDMLYLPAHIGHYGTAIGTDCITYSFGYRSYSDQEFWDSFGDFCAEKKVSKSLYRDPNWTTLQGTSEIPLEALENAKKVMQAMLEDKSQLTSWFGCYVTRLDEQAETLLPMPIEKSLAHFIKKMEQSEGFVRNSCCRFAYHLLPDAPFITLFINGIEWNTEMISTDFITYVANHRLLPLNALKPWLRQEADTLFLYDLWKLQWLELVNLD